MIVSETRLNNCENSNLYLEFRIFRAAGALTTNCLNELKTFCPVSKKVLKLSNIRDDPGANGRHLVRLVNRLLSRSAIFVTFQHRNNAQF